MDLPNQLPGTPSPEPSDPNGAPYGAVTLRYCKDCGHDVVPIGKGRCPVHQRWLPANHGAQKHTADVALYETYLRKVLADHPPRTTVERVWCEELAGAMADAKAMRRGSTEWTRTQSEIRQLHADLKSIGSTTSACDLDALDADALVALAVRLHAEAVRMRDAQRGGDAVTGSVTPTITS
jgi:hypothetical protein